MRENNSSEAYTISHGSRIGPPVLVPQTVIEEVPHVCAEHLEELRTNGRLGRDLEDESPLQSTGHDSLASIPEERGSSRLGLGIT